MDALSVASQVAARRVERAFGAIARSFADTVITHRLIDGVVVEPHLGGVFTYYGNGQPLTKGTAVGIDGPATDQEIDASLTFFQSRAAAPIIEVATVSDPSIATGLQSRGLLPIAPILAFAAPTHSVSCAMAATDRISLRRVTDPSDEEFTETVGRGFAEGAPVPPAFRWMSSATVLSPLVVALVASVDGIAAGGGSIAIVRDQLGAVGIALGGAVLPAFRGMGVHSALMRERLRIGASEGCDLLVSQCLGATISERTIRRAGLSHLYTRSRFVASPV